VISVCRVIFNQSETDYLQNVTYVSSRNLTDRLFHFNGFADVEGLRCRHKMPKSCDSHYVLLQIAVTLRHRSHSLSLAP
jgi:hypothetical protein